MQARARIGAIDSRRHAHGARETAEVPFDQVKTRGLALGEIRTLFLADHQHHAGLEEDADAVGRHAGQIEHDLDALFGLEHIDAGHAFTRDHVPPIGAPLRQLVEEALHVVGQFRRVELYRARGTCAHRSILRA
jgi:hypothetical protein